MGSVGKTKTPPRGGEGQFSVPEEHLQLQNYNSVRSPGVPRNAGRFLQYRRPDDGFLAKVGGFRCFSA